MHKQALCALTLIAISPFTVAKTNQYIGIYEDSYIIQTYTDNINQEVYDKAYTPEKMDKMNKMETKFQFSFGIPLVRVGSGSLMLSYTQMSLWQLGNEEASSPFRETNYKPQLFVMHQGRFPLFNNIEYGYRHQSNGRDMSITRSWDMVFLNLEKIESRVEYGINGWYAFRKDENEDITDFIPTYDLWLGYKSGIGNVKLRGAYDFRVNKGHYELSYTYPVSKFIGLYVQLWDGYGETLIDYNHNQTRIGAGIKINSDLKLM